MGFARGAFTYLISSTSLSLLENFYSFCHHERGVGEKLILTVRAVMLDEHVDLVAGDFNGTAWRCSNRNKHQHN